MQELHRLKFNVYLALNNNLEIIPVLNKVDLPAADPDRVAEEIEHLPAADPDRVAEEIEQTIGLDCADIVEASSKTGIGITEILESIVKLVPPQPAATGGPFRALIFDLFYDPYRGVVILFCVVDGEVSTGSRIRFLASAAEHEVSQVYIVDSLFGCVIVVVMS
jgi:GTP-binding protein LepA